MSDNVRLCLAIADAAAAQARQCNDDATTMPPDHTESKMVYLTAGLVMSRFAIALTEAAGKLQNDESARRGMIGSQPPEIQEGMAE